MDGLIQGTFRSQFDLLGYIESCQVELEAMGHEHQELVDPMELLTAHIVRICPGGVTPCSASISSAGTSTERHCVQKSRRLHSSAIAVHNGIRPCNRPSSKASKK